MNFYKNGTSQHIICHEFFRDIDTEIKAYLLGFLYADGCVYYIKKDNMFRLATTSKKACKKLFDYFYAESHFYYERKFNKFNYYVNTEVSQLIADHRNA